MDMTYEDLKDVHVRAYVVYGKAADKKLYYEPDYKTQVTQADLEDAFGKCALVVVDGSTKHRPVSITANKVSTVGIVSSALALVEWTALATA